MMNDIASHRLKTGPTTCYLTIKDLNPTMYTVRRTLGPIFPRQCHFLHAPSGAALLYQSCQSFFSPLLLVDKLSLHHLVEITNFNHFVPKNRNATCISFVLDLFTPKLNTNLRFPQLIVKCWQHLLPGYVNMQKLADC